MISREQFKNGIASYLDAELMTKIQLEPWKQWAFGTGVSILIKRMDGIINSLAQDKTIVSLGIIDTNGNVDIDILYSEAKNNIPPEGVKVQVPLVGDLTFFPSDTDSLYRHIMGG